MVKTYVWNILVAIDQLFNALLAGDPDETISSRAAKAQRQGKRWGCVLCKFLHWLDANHCDKNVEADEGSRAAVQHGARPIVNFWLAVFAAGSIVGLLVAHNEAEAQTLDPLVEHRYCGPPRRNASGEIIRRADVLAAYQRQHPCPATGQPRGACPGWAKNHVIPLACGGCDAVWNLTWMRVDAKRLVDSYERKISAATPPVDDTDKCVNQLVQ